MTASRQVLGAAGILVALLSVATGSQAMVWVAIGLLGGSVVIRIGAGIRARREPPSGERPPEG